MAIEQDSGGLDGSAGVLERLAATRQLLDGGAPRCAKKLGEEAVEVVIASLQESDEALKGEAADLVYHLLVLLEARGVALEDVLATLEKRMGLSGLDEKASRGRKGR